MIDEEPDLEGAPPQLRLDGFDDVLVDPDRNSWCTPPEWTSILGDFDLDCCSNPRATIRAARTFMLENGQDGLALARYVGRKTKVWCNPPYGPGLVMQWVRAYRHTRFVFLVRNDTSTEWFAELEPYVALICTPRCQRIKFSPPPGAKASTPDSIHQLYYANEEDATEEVKRLCYAWRPVRS